MHHMVTSKSAWKLMAWSTPAYCREPKALRRRPLLPTSCGLCRRLLSLGDLLTKGNRDRIPVLSHALPKEPSRTIPPSISEHRKPQTHRQPTRQTQRSENWRLHPYHTCPNPSNPLPPRTSFTLQRWRKKVKGNG